MQTMTSSKYEIQSETNKTLFRQAQLEFYGNSLLSDMFSEPLSFSEIQGNSLDIFITTQNLHYYLLLVRKSMDITMLFKFVIPNNLGTLSNDCLKDPGR